MRTELRMKKENISEKELSDALYKKALGYETKEVVEEYFVDENGECTLNKKKITKKYVSPDLTTAKLLLEKHSDKNMEEIRKMSDEEITRRELEILQELKKISKKSLPK